MRGNGLFLCLYLAVLAGGDLKMEIKSPAFRDGGSIPPMYTCDGADLSPPLTFNAPPKGTRSLALIVDDPDAPAGIWVHWVAWNIPPGARSLEEGVQKSATLPDGTHQGVNDFGRVGYGGPCPPSGTHRYFFKLYALDRSLDLKPTTTSRDLQTSMQGHVLAQAEVIGRYARRSN